MRVVQTIELVLVVALGGVLIWLVTSHVLERAGGLAQKATIGLAVGVLAAIVVSALVGDLVPDEIEGQLLGGLAVLISLLLVGAFAMRRWAER